MIPDLNVTDNGDLPLSTLCLEYRNTTLRIVYEKLSEDSFFMSARLKGTDKFPLPTFIIEGEMIDSLEVFIEDHKKFIDAIHLERHLNSQFDS